jgi:hypothetical protein
MIVFLFILMMLDYALTMIGIGTGFIEEGNGLMCWLVNMPWYYGVVVKAAMSVLLLTPLYIAKQKQVPLYRTALIIVLIAYACVFTMHIYWITMYWSVMS